MLLSPEKANEKLVLPYKNENDIQSYVACMTPTYYNSEENYVILQSAFVYDWNKYFDMNKMKQLIQNANIEYK